MLSYALLPSDGDLSDGLCRLGPLGRLRTEKMPRLFRNGPSKEELAALARQRDFARDRVLGKRPADEAGSYGAIRFSQVFAFQSSFS